MNKILQIEKLCPAVSRMVLEAPLIAQKALPGQFVIIRADADGERIPLTVADTDASAGTVSIIFQQIGATTMQLGAKKVGDFVSDLAGPLGKPTETAGIKKAAVVGGGVGSAIAYPVAKQLSKQGAVVHTVVGFRNSSLVILEDEFKACSDKFVLVSDDGSTGRKGLVTDALRELLDSGEVYDEVIVIGPLIMMKFVCALTKQYGVKTVVSMNPIMIDGTGMCGCCRLTVGGEMKFACVDGPDFDGHLVDFDEAMSRSGIYRDFERTRREETCNLLNQ